MGGDLQAICICLGLGARVGVKGVGLVAFADASRQARPAALRMLPLNAKTPSDGKG